MKKVVLSAFAMILAVSVSFAQDKKPEEKKPVKKSSEQYIADLNPSSDEKTISEAAEWAGNEKEKKAVKNLVSLINDNREGVRLNVVIALGYIGDETSVDSLNNSMLNDASSEVRYAAILSTLRIGSKKSIDSWKKVKEQESDPYIKDVITKMEEKAKGK